MNFIAAPLFAMSTSVLIAILLGFLRGGLDARSASISLALGGLVAAATCWRERWNSRQFRRLNGWEWSAIVVFTLFSLRAFLWLITKQRDDIMVMSPNNLGDMSLHLTYINQLAGGAPFWPDNPIVSGAKLTYPLGVDLYNALLTLCGIDTLRGLIWVGLVGCVLTGLALWRWGGAFTLFGFLCNGGLAGFVALRTGELLDYQSELAWKSIPLALFVTQRGLLFAIPAGLLLLLSWQRRFFARDGGLDRRPLPVWGEVLLYASMPVFHLHTFLFLSLVLAVWFVMRPELRIALARFVGFALLPASVLVLLETNFFRGPSVIAWHLGWMQSEAEFLEMCRDRLGTNSAWVTAPFFWLLNFGVLPFFVVATCVRVWRSTKRDWAAAALIPALLAFGLCCVIRFAPWPWDNTKLMLWSYVVILPFLWSEVLVRWPYWLRIICCFGLFWSGFVSMLGGLDRSQKGFSIATRSELDTLAPALRGIPVTERFIARPNYNHPLLLLGRPLAQGYNGHVWSHGYRWVESEARIESILRGEEGWQEKWRETGAKLLFWGSQEREAYPDSTQAWRETARLVASGSWGEIYDLSAPAEGPEPANR